ncbi:MAG: toll/interleukin-1 receptor domain-containing protein [Caulobacter sp.]
MRIFISWSGERSQTLATAIREWLPLVLHYADPWLSQADIDAGDRWSEAIAKELDACSFGITCVTSENVNSPWILFESGALAKSMEKGRVLPLLLDLDVRDISGPLAQFQAKKAEKNGLLDAISSMNKNAPNPEPEERVKLLFEALWPQLEQKISEIPKSQSSSKQSRPQSEILEELVTSVRNLDLRYRDEFEDGRSPRRSKRAQMRMMMADDFVHRSMEDSRDPIGIVAAASFLRDDYPWVYELALELYRAIKSGRLDEAQTTQKMLFESFSMLQRGPFLDDMEGRGLHVFMRTIDRPMEHWLGGDRSRKPSKSLTGVGRDAAKP